MRRKHIAWITGLLTAAIGIGCHAQKQTQTTAQSPAAHTLLWRISGKGITKPSYLYGTMHVLCADDVALSDSLKAVIAHCDELYFEINLSDMAGMLSSMKYMRMNDSKRLSDLLKPDEYAKVKDYFAKHASMLPFGMLERFKPMLISGLIEQQGMECQTADGMELMIMKEGRPYRKPVRGLETAEFQAGLFDSIPYELQAKELVSYIDSMDINSKMMRELVELYKRQDLEGIDRLSQKDDNGISGYMDMLLYNRNRKWATALDSLLTKIVAGGGGGGASARCQRRNRVVKKRRAIRLNL
ncbi:TraB/GumN family protein [Puia sp. P3]|uniref:TraB/GumN family protein n=1 Tax=Puia sp. P3 TaxID=3423952 RepID=UPI003D66F983